ncbi:MAG: pyrroline-5-carboxylate reductase [Betaproteobacteria bacterium]
MTHLIAIIGGGQMASALIGGLIQRGRAASQIAVVEPFEGARADLLSRYGVQAHSAAGAFLQEAALVVWAIKPQTFAQAAQAAQAHTRAALHLSVAAGIRSDTLAQWLHSERIVRAMPNTPALIGQGISGLYARAGVNDADKAQIEQVMGCTGSFMWLEAEAQIDAVTALSGSGPAYVFYFLEAMREAGSAMGLTPAQSYQLAIATFSGASALAAASSDAPEVLRERVTSKGGTTFAALSAMEQAGIKPAFIAAMQAAHQRAQELGDAFGAQP